AWNRFASRYVEAALAVLADPHVGEMLSGDEQIHQLVADKLFDFRAHQRDSRLDSGLARQPRADAIGMRRKLPGSRQGDRYARHRPDDVTGGLATVDRGPALLALDQQITLVDLGDNGGKPVARKHLSGHDIDPAVGPRPDRIQR